MALVSNCDFSGSSDYSFHLSEDKADHMVLAERLAHQTGFPVAVPNYRLTPREQTKNNVLQHPSHAEDILHFLEFLGTWNGPLNCGRACDKQRLFLMGHSCGAHILSCILLDSSAVIPSLTPSITLLDAVKGIVLSEGIFDLDLLNAHFPDYLGWFIAPAFGKLDSYAAFTVTRYPMRSRRHECNWLLIHSSGDTLVDLTQSEQMLRHLRTKGPPDGQIILDTSFTQGHDDILSSENFVDAVMKFIQTVLEKESG